MMVALTLVVSANAQMCEDAIDNTPIDNGTSINPISVKQEIIDCDTAVPDEDSRVVSTVSTFKGSPSKVNVKFDQDKIGIDY